jgi:hypothetical protein
MNANSIETPRASHIGLGNKVDIVYKKYQWESIIANHWCCAGVGVVTTPSKKCLCPYLHLNTKNYMYY